MGKNEASKQELEDARAAFAQREAELTQELRCTLHACEEAQAHAADLAGERDVAAARADQSKAELQEVREGAQQQQTALQMALREAEGQRGRAGGPERRARRAGGGAAGRARRYQRGRDRHGDAD